MPSARQRNARSGFTLVELMIVVVILGILASIGSVLYVRVVDRARMIAAIGDIRAISSHVDEYYYANGNYPSSLAILGLSITDDPWGNPYKYTELNGGKNKGKARKDKNLVPINTDYDLYSSGPDGSSFAPLTANPSRDDIVRANNGGFVGLAESY